MLELLQVTILALCSHPTSTQTIFLGALILLLIMGCCYSHRGAVYKQLLSKQKSYPTRGNEENAEMLVSSYLHEEEEELDIHIPSCIHYLCLQYFFVPTNVIFHHYDRTNSWNVDISNDGKRLRVSNNTIFVFSETGYCSGIHSWSVKLLNCYNCQALGIAEHKDATYRYGYNIFDAELNRQLGDRYVYAGDLNHGWRGSTELRPYVVSASDSQLRYEKKLKMKNNRWQRNDVITVEINFSGDPWTIQFFKNGQVLCDKIVVKNKKVYYPVVQVYQRGTFEILDNYDYYPCDEA
mmetsp:Transcript_70890/g.112645  ORF Transcript_70890/g.112645 Transcript_70890/m.112645 type:complete len:294 (-) Transcript_70890:138-1019(-)